MRAPSTAGANPGTTRRSILSAPPPLPFAPPVGKTPNVVKDRASEMLLRERRKRLALRSLVFFAAYYFRTDKGKEFNFQPFHVEMMDLAQDEEGTPLLALYEPASFGKSTVLAKIYCIWKAIKDPNERGALGGKTFDDATRRMRSIKAELEGNRLLIDDFGPFVGDVWKEDQINLRGRTSTAKETTITAFGSETNVFGWRADWVVLDDIVTIQNSGQQVKDDTRERLHANFHDGIMKMGTVGERFVVRWVNTVVHLRDLCHSVGRLGDHEDPNETGWTTPDGWRVVRRQAINESTGEPLWPEVYGAKEAEADRNRDIVAFMRRMQNRIVEPGMMSFQRVWFNGNGAEFPGCLDLTRGTAELIKLALPGGLEQVVGIRAERPQGMGDAVVVTAGYDPNFGMSDKAKYCGWIALAFNRAQPEPRAYSVTEIVRFRTGVEEQGVFVTTRHKESGSAKTKVERNAQNQMVLSLKSVKDAIASGARIEPHWTSETNKPDADIGIPSLGGIVKAGLLRLPYSDPTARQFSDLLIGEAVGHPMAVTSDLLMAWWFAIIAAREIARFSALSVVRRGIPKWASGFGLRRSA